MLVELSIENFAIIKKINIVFTKGFNVFTGETGVGKSIIIDAIGILLGGRASRTLVRTGSDRASIQGLFYLEYMDKIGIYLNNYGIKLENDKSLLITRDIYSNGRSICRINGRTVTLNMLNNITKNLIDIHGQHQHQSLLNLENHIKFVDCFGDDEFRKLKQKINIKYDKLVEMKKQLNNLSINGRDKKREVDLLKYELQEIDCAKLSEGEEEKVLNEYNKLYNSKEILCSLSQITSIINSNDYNSFSLTDGINKCISLMQNIIEYDKNLDKYNNYLQSINYEIEDLNREIRNYLEEINFDEERLVFLEERIDTINKLKNKYGNTISEIFEYRDDINKKLQNLINNGHKIRELNKEILEIKNQLMVDCKLLSSKRKKISLVIEQNILKELQELNMKNIKFKVKFKKLDYFTHNGLDKVEFLISTNVGEELKPLSKIISGGEMSRIMLAFKRILADYDKIPCLIFDEIDTGISGRTAQIVGEKISSISKTHQIICISHLPQVAALADTHFVINKISTKIDTSTIVKKLNYTERIDELSRLLGGVSLTDTTKLHAKEMLEMSKKFKNKKNNHF